MSEKKEVYHAIATVSGRLAKDGISKDRKNVQQGYQFRGIDDFYNALAPILSDVGLCILPRVLSREVTERETSKGGAIFYVVVKVDFDFVSAKDGSTHTISTFGEAMDTADKATNKAMSAAYKYACMQAFCIPTQGDNDADSTTHEVKASALPGVKIKALVDAQLGSLRDASLQGMTALKKAVQSLPEGEAFDALWKQHSAALKEAAKKADAPATSREAATKAVEMMGNDIPF